MSSLSRIHLNDIVEVDVKGRIGVGLVEGKANRRLQIRPLTHNFTWREVSGVQVKRHWRLTKNTPKPRHA